MRYAVVGPLWGSLEILEALPIADLNGWGARVKSPHPMVEESTHAARLVLGRQVFDLHIRVRHSAGSASAPAAGAQEAHVGLEFIGLSPSGSEEIDRYLAS